jgi:hypothetical protein
VKTSIRSVAAALAMAAALITFASAEADARPPRTVEDKIAELKAGCANAGAEWGTMSRSFTCTYYYPDVGNGVERWDRWHYSNSGAHTQICYRFDIEGQWFCNPV